MKVESTRTHESQQRSAQRTRRHPAAPPLLLAVSALMLAASVSPAATVPTGYQEYFVLGYEQHTWDMMDKVQNGQGGAQFGNGMNSVVTATASADNQVIFYDQWEDGFEADILNPVQLSTLVIGDGDPSNGDACDFNNDPCGTDLLLTGDFVNFSSNQGLGAGCTVPSAQPATFTQLCSSVPVNPRCATAGSCTNAEVRFDGGDLMVTSGGPLSVVHSEDPLTQYIGGSTEMLSRQAVEAARSYSVPVGEDLYPAFGCPNCVMEPFHYVDLNLVAFEDGTQVFVDSPGAGTASFTLNRGEHWSSLGYIDDGAFDPAVALTINAGTKVSTSGPVTGLLFTGGDGTWATRHYALLPDILHSTDYVITAPGDDPAVGPSAPTNRPLDIYILNPDPLNSIDVTATDTTGTTVVNIPPNSMVDYFSATGRFVPTASTVRLTSDSNFWGISAYDYNTNISDWGHSWLATKFLTRNYTISYAPGNMDPTVNTVNLNGVFIAAVQDNTLVQIDLDGDGIWDPVDTDGDGTIDPAPLPNNTYRIDALGAMRVFDPNDFDNTGTRIEANKPVAVAWGQDTELTGYSDAALDTGYTVYPTNRLFLDPVLVIEKESSTTSVPTSGGTVTYTLDVQSFGFGPLTVFSVFDILPLGVSGTDYVAGSTLITYPNLTQGTADPVVSVDPATGRDRLEWALAPAILGTNQTLTVRYSVAIPSGPIGLLTNEGHAEGRLGGSTFSPFDTAEVVRTDVTLTKSSSDDGSPSGGERMDFTLTVENTGATAESNVVISDPIPADTTFLPAAQGGGVLSNPPFSGTYNAAQNAVVWTAAILPAGSGPITLGFPVTVNPRAPAGTVILNRGGYESSETPYFLSNEVDPVIVGPALELLKTGPSLLHPNEVAAFEIIVRNVGAGAANNLSLIDPFPLNTTYVPGSMEWRLNALPFASLTDAADGDQGTALASRVEFLLARLGANQDVTFRFEVRVAPGTGGSFVNNQATVSSDELTPTDTNLVQVPVVGNASVTGHVFLDVDGDGIQGAGEPNLANVDVFVTDSAGQLQVVATDANGDWLATVGSACYRDEVNTIGYSGSDGALAWGSTPWFETSDDGDPTSGDVQSVLDPLGVFGNSLRLTGDPVSNTRALSRPADLTSLSNAVMSFDYRRVSLEANDSVSIEVSYDGGAAFSTLGSLGNATDGAWQSQSYTLDPAQLPTGQLVVRFRTNNFNFGNDTFYFDNVAVCGTNATADVDENDPDFPNGAVLSTGNDPQVVVVVPGGTVATTPVGYEPGPLTFTKNSDAVGGQVTPGQTITYTLEAVNNTGATQTGVTITDPVPVGTTYVPGSASASVPTFRATEYYIGPGTFNGTTYDLTLNQVLATDYFAIVQGSDGDGSGGNDRGPDENYAALTADPFGTGDLSVSSAPDILSLTRQAAVNGWVGVVTVVECLGACGTSGFRLLDVQRVVHSGATASGSDTSAVPWTDLGRVMLMGGFNGPGCDTAEANVANTKVCHVRLVPSGTDVIDWTRDAGGATLSTATSTVMSVQWGSEWTVQRVRVQGSNGGDGVNAIGEYNTATIGPVSRAETWVWGTGHTDDNGIGDAAEAVVVTLGDGVNQNATETTVAVATEYGGTNVDFEVWALSHPSLAAGQQFQSDGNQNSLTVDVGVGSAGVQRFGLAYNSQSGTGTAYPRPMLSARYTDDSTVRLERRRSGQPFAAWVQGVDLSAFEAAVSGPPDLIVPADGVTIPAGDTFTVTFQVVVNDPLAPGLTDITNTATLTTNEQPGPFVDSVIDFVVRPSVIVEPNNAGYAIAGSTITYSHEVVNTATISDSFSITGGSELGWPVELIDPNTGAIIAADADGDGAWDNGAAVNAGTLPPGGRIEYQVRVTVPGGTIPGTEDTTRLVATSDRSPSTRANATDETTVLSATTGQIILTPDNSGIAEVGSSTAYSHVVVNNTATADTMDLYADSAAGWTSTLHWDANGDGVYTPGIDLQIANTSLLSPGGSQLIFVVVAAPAGAVPGDNDVVHLTAVSRNDPTLFGAATDTTTVVGAPAHDLSGGGSLVVAPGETAVHPGTLQNLGDSPDRYNLSISVSNLWGVDGLLHSTLLRVDTNADGIPDTDVARDDDGDGTWDFVLAGWDTDGDGLPDVPVSAGTTAAYELRRAIDPNQSIQRDYVTLTSDSIGSPGSDPDNVTATWLFAAATRAAIRGLRVDPGGEVAFVTATQVNTASFVVYQTDDRTGATGRERLHDEAILAPVPDSLGPILYRARTRRVTQRFVMIEETEVDGNVLWQGPFRVGDRRLLRRFETIERLMDRAGIPREAVRRTRGMRPLRALADEAEGLSGNTPRRRSPRRAGNGRRRGRDASGVKIEVLSPGQVTVPTGDLEAAGLPRLRPGALVHLTHLGRPVPYGWVPGTDNSWSLRFEAKDLPSDFSDRNVYVATVGGSAFPPTVQLTVSAKPLTPGYTRVEKNVLYVPSLPEGPDPWQWDMLFSGWPWPDPSWDPAAGDFDLPDLAPGATGPVAVQIRVNGYTHHSHSVTATLNGLPVGSLQFEGAVEATLEGIVAAEALRATGNQLSLTYIGSSLPDSPEGEAMAYLDYMDLAIPPAGAARTAEFELAPYRPRLPSLRKVEYLIVTHPLFREQADRVALLKSAEGLRAVVVETEAAYDLFSGGFVEPRAIQALIHRAATRSRSLRYVLLVGDDTFDPRDYVGMGSRSFVPSLYARDETWGLVPSENRFADLDGDDRPDVAIGRLPVQSVTEAEAVVDKIAGQTQALRELLGSQLAVVDNSTETDAPFRADAEKALAQLPGGPSAHWSDVSQGADVARQALLAGWQSGAMLTHYFGHGGLTEWADEQILTHADIAAHGPTWKPTVLFTWACLSQWHVGLFGPALNEALLLEPGGGAVASFGPVGITPPARQAALIDALYQELGRPDLTLGEAIRRAKAAAVENNPNAREVVDGFQLFGDPALRLPWDASAP